MSDYPSVVFEIAHQTYLQGRNAEAEALLKLLMGSGWRDAYISYFIGHLEFLQNNMETAVGYLQAAIEMDPNHARSHNDLGEALRVLGRHEEAEPILKRAIELEPTLAYPYGNLGAVLHALNRDEEALGWLQRSLRLADDRAIAHCDLGATLAWLNRHEEAIEQYRLAQQIQPDYPRARYSESLSLLTLGEFQEGWVKHEARLGDTTNGHVPRELQEPQWRGENIAGKTILLHAEQGHGDAIQFARYVPYVVATGATVLLEVHHSLQTLFERIPGVATLYAPRDNLPPFDLQCSLMSLPNALRAELGAIPATVPYLSVEPPRVAAWRERLGPRRRMRIGLAWSGSAGFANDRNRSIPLATLVKLLSRPDIEFHVLQPDVRDTDRAVFDSLPLHKHGAKTLGDFANTGALMTLMDLIITVDTVFGHLGGALGLPTWVMVPWAPDWRWMMDRSDSPWYRTVRLFRQPHIGDWSSVMVEIARALDAGSMTR